MKKKLTITIASILLFIPFLSFAQEDAGTEEIGHPILSTSETPIIPEVSPKTSSINVTNAQIIYSNVNNFKISFDIINGQEVQPGVRYALRLMNVDTGAMVEQKIYDEVLTLYPNQTIKKEIEYTAPSYLKGKFRLLIRAENEVGFLMSFNRVGEFDLNGDGKILEIRPESCYLTVEGESEDKKYSARQGVDVIESENLIAKCELINHLGFDVNIESNFRTWERNAFGKPVKLNNVSSDRISLKSGEKKTVAITLPKASNPQAYDVELTFGSNGKVISNAILFHYVIRGNSATIQNIMFDKSYYGEDEVANILFIWTGSADNFPGSRAENTKSTSGAKLEISVFNSEGEACSSLNQELASDAQGEPIKFSLKMKNACQDPEARIAIKDENGIVLAERNIKTKSQESEILKAKEDQSKQDKKSLINIVLIVASIFTGAMLIIIFMSFYFKKKRTYIANIAFLVIISGMLFIFSFNKVLAAQWMSSNIDRTYYNMGDTMIISTALNFVGCLNEGTTGLTFHQDFYIDQISSFGSKVLPGCSGALDTYVGYGDYEIHDTNTSYFVLTSARIKAAKLKTGWHTLYVENREYPRALFDFKSFWSLTSNGTYRTYDAHSFYITVPEVCNCSKSASYCGQYLSKTDMGNSCYCSGTKPDTYNCKLNESLYCPGSTWSATSICNNTYPCTGGTKTGNGKCNAGAINKMWTSKPSGTLCDAGVATDPEVKGNSWCWICSSACPNSGSSDSCCAKRDLNLKEVEP